MCALAGAACLAVGFHGSPRSSPHGSATCGARLLSCGSPAAVRSPIPRQGWALRDGWGISSPIGPLRRCTAPRRRRGHLSCGCTLGPLRGHRAQLRRAVGGVHTPPPAPDGVAGASPGALRCPAGRCGATLGSPAWGGGGFRRPGAPLAMARSPRAVWAHLGPSLGIGRARAHIVRGTGALLALGASMRRWP